MCYWKIGKIFFKDLYLVLIILQKQIFIWMLLIRGFFIEKSKVNLDFKRSNNMYMYYLDILCFVY